MSRCPCNFPDSEHFTRFSAEWSRKHRDHHLATYPDVDQTTRDNLDWLVRLAEEREAAGA